MSAPDSGPLAQVTAADVLRWGRAQPADTSIGECLDPMMCLVGLYAAEVLDVNLDIHPNRPEIAEPFYSDGLRDYPLPDDLNVLAACFDGLLDHVGGGVTRFTMYPADLNRLTMEVAP